MCAGLNIMTRIIISGINGRMGKALEQMCENSDEFEIVSGIDLNLGIPHTFPTVSSPDELDVKADAVIDFSHHSAANKLCAYAVKTGTPVVFSTTGYTDEELELIKKTSESAAVFRSGNMSVGINLITELAKRAASVLSDFDAEIVEMHHNQKLDAPSGTALMIADGIKSVRPDSEYVYDRTKERKKRGKKEIGIHSVRAGSIVGEHEVIFGGANEVIKISHSALSREVFASGALKAAAFLKGKKNGMYNMSDMLADII